MRSSVLAGGALLGAPMINRGRFQMFAGTPAYSARTLALVERSLVVDMLSLLTLDWPRLERWHARPSSFGNDDIAKLRQSGVTVFHPAVELGADDPWAATRRWFRDWNRFIDVNRDSCLRIDSPADFDVAKEEGKIGILLGHQNSCHFRKLEDVSAFHAMGQRVSQLTYNAYNAIGAGCTEREDRGLTPYGALIVEEMNRVGMAVDVSHCGKTTALDAFSVSKKPVLVTHANCKGLVPEQDRCKSDEVIARMAAGGGVMGITAIRPFVRAKDPTTLEHMLDHFDYTARLAGIEHVGLGSDRDFDDRTRQRIQPRMDIAGLNHPQRVYDLTEGLVRRGYTDRSIELILGGNFKRVLSEIWTTSVPS